MATLKVAVTGGIGSGKSSVCKIIKELGYAVISCDSVYSELLREESFCKGIYNSVGMESFKGEFDRKAVADKVFEDSALIKKLNEYTHPIIMSRVVEIMDQCNSIAFCEVPLLFEGGFEKLFDRVIIVKRNLNDRIKAVCKRDGCAPQEAKRRIDNQIDYECLKINAHTVIYNDGDFASLKQKTGVVIDEIIKD